MRNALVYFKEDAVTPFKELKEIENVFLPKGIAFDTVSILSPTDDLAFKRQFSSLTQTVDNLFVFVAENMEFDFKSVISEEMDSELFENDNAVSVLQDYAAKHGGSVDKEYALLPVSATVIPNQSGRFQGFMMEDASFTLVVLPCGEKYFLPMCTSFVLPYFENKYSLGIEKFDFKYFGSGAVLEKSLSSIKEEFHDAFDFLVKSSCGDNTVHINFADGEKSVKQNVLRRVISTLKDNVYAEFDTSLSERLFDALKLKNVKISIAESFTGGRIVSSIISNPGASKFVHEGIVSYSNLSKIRRLSVKESDIDSVGAVSPEIAYQMARGLLKEGVDIAVSTTGIAGPKSDDTYKPVGLCYIGIGTKQSIHVYKYHFSGDRETITETAKNTAMFLTIKRLKNF